MSIKHEKNSSKGSEGKYTTGSTLISTLPIVYMLLLDKARPDGAGALFTAVVAPFMGFLNMQPVSRSE